MPTVIVALLRTSADAASDEAFAAILFLTFGVSKTTGKSLLQAHARLVRHETDPNECNKTDPARILFHHLIGAGEQRCWRFDAQRLSGLEVQEQFKSCALLYRQFSRLFAFENAASVDASKTVRVEATTIAHEATRRDKQTVSKDRGYSVMGCQCTEHLISAREEWIGADHQSSCPQLDHSREKRIEFVLITGVQYMKFDAEARRRRSRFGRIGLSYNGITRIDEERHHASFGKKLVEYLQSLWC